MFLHNKVAVQLWGNKINMFQCNLTMEERYGKLMDGWICSLVAHGWQFYCEKAEQSFAA